MFKRQATLGWILFFIFPAANGCVQLQLDPVIDVDETETDRVLITLLETSATTSSWTLSVLSPSGIAAYLEHFLRVEQNTSNPSEWNVVLEKSLDIEEIYSDTKVFLNLMTLRLTCTDNSSPTPLQEEFERFVYITAVSEFIPKLMTDSIEFNVSEDAAIGSELVDLMDYVVDEDVVDTVALNDVERFQLVPYFGQEVDGAGIFTILPTGALILSRSVDYENLSSHLFVLNVTVEDKGNLMSWSTVNIRVTNANDNAPSFVLANCQSSCSSVTEYRATINPNVTGPLTSLNPGNIKAIDIDGDPLTFQIMAGSPSEYDTFISIDSQTGQVSLKEPLSNVNISHFTLVIEVSDANTSLEGRALNEPSHTTVASLLVFVAGRQVGFPAAPGPGDNSSSASWNSDPLFVSTLVLSILLLLAIGALVVLVCQLRKTKALNDDPQASRCNTIKDRNPSDWSIQMRSMHHGSEKAFMRSLSQATSGSHGYYDNNNETDDVFTTGIVPHYNIATQPDPPSMPPAPGVIPYQEALTHFTSTSTNVGTSQEGNMRSGRVGSSSSSSHNVYTSGIKTRDSQGSHQATDDADAGHSNLESLYRALDVLTSVTPFPAQPGVQQPPTKRSQSSQDLMTKSDYVTTKGALASSESNQRSNADTLKVQNRRSSEPPTGSNVTRNDTRVLDEQTSRTDRDRNFESELFPLDEFYFKGSVHQSLDKDNNTFKRSTTAKTQFQENVETRANPNQFKFKGVSQSGRNSIDRSSIANEGPVQLSKAQIITKWDTDTDCRTVL